MRSLFVSIGILVGLSGCPGGSPSDGAVDMTQPLDLAALTFCQGTPIAGTCVQSYMAPVAACFNATGTCTTNAPSPGDTNTCWETGAQFLSTTDTASMKVQGNWKSENGAKTCMTGEFTAAGFTFTTSSGKLTYNPASGAVTCPDNSTLNLSASGQYGGCAAFKDLVGVPMQRCITGKCP